MTFAAALVLARYVCVAFSFPAFSRRIHLLRDGASNAALSATNQRVEIPTRDVFFSFRFFLLFAVSFSSCVISVLATTYLPLSSFFLPSLVPSGSVFLSLFPLPSSVPWFQFRRIYTFSIWLPGVAPHRQASA